MLSCWNIASDDKGLEPSPSEPRLDPRRPRVQGLTDVSPGMIAEQIHHFSNEGITEGEVFVPLGKSECSNQYIHRHDGPVPPSIFQAHDRRRLGK
jgi:hypothetical protein